MLSAAVMSSDIGTGIVHTLAAVAERGIPILVFLIAISIVVNLSSAAGVFDRVAGLAAQVSRGRKFRLWLVLAIIATVSTAFLSLDTTAVMLTPIAVAVARSVGVSPIPYAFTIVWLANTASLFLPVSNLTNLLALQGPKFANTPDFFRVAAAPAAAVTIVTIGYSALVFRRQLRGRYRLPAPDQSGAIRNDTAEPANPLFGICAAVLAILLPLLATAIPYWASTSVAAVVLLLAFAIKNRRHIRLSLVPWHIIALAAVLVVGVQLSHELLGTLLLPQLTGDSAGDHAVLASGGAILSNAINNLPAYLLWEPAAVSATGLVALLIGTNVGPIILPWASLANLLWHDQLKRAGTEITWKSFMVHGIVLAPLAMVAGLATLWSGV